MAPVRGKVILALAFALLVVGCGRPSVDYYRSILDELPIPAGWDLATETVRAPGTATTCATILPGCPAVARYFLSDGLPTDVFPVARQLITEAGFSIYLESTTGCKSPPESPACFVFGTRGDDELSINLYNPGNDPDSVGVASDDRTMLRVTASPK
jgi:hypothetical protein